MTISKLDAARRQLLAAIHIQWFLNEPLAAYQLASNASEICDQLLKRTGKIRMRKKFVEVHGSTEKQINDTSNRPRNFAKHANSDPDALLDDITDLDAETIILVACLDYSVLAGKSPIPVGLFITWFAAVYPEKTGWFFKKEADDWFPHLSTMERAEQIAASRAAVRKPPESAVLNSRRTELTDNSRWVELRRSIK
ncbi:hypothetical protein [Rhizobium sp. Leaf341]|uniref:hypothetical protein n=1 Tax=Rhizobium sp. Leaf341 TaxID=1736344 RepID=UPI000713982F|nr:hypothetical protein [Rhizobium sp. Leaf341]KQR77548.1 hypothetical protein ASG03_14135 [Rhizobium sp. Leaf341]